MKLRRGAPLEKWDLRPASTRLVNKPLGHEPFGSELTTEGLMDERLKSSRSGFLLGRANKNLEKAQRTSQNMNHKSK
jgi:hypothetical protein